MPEMKRFAANTGHLYTQIIYLILLITKQIIKAIIVKSLMEYLKQAASFSLTKMLLGSKCPMQILP